jgi:hypothetical protein
MLEDHERQGSFAAWLGSGVERSYSLLAPGR